MKHLNFTSCLSANADTICQAIANYLAERLPLPVKFINHIPWPQRVALLDEAQIHIGWICGLLYVWKRAQARAQLELLAAPVMRAPRYQNRPIYFSDVVVHHDSPHQTFADLRGTTWAYNEPGSYSGYYLVRYHLAMLGEISGYFGRVIESGAHQASLRLVVNGQADAAAIDSIALDLELAQQPALRAQIRVVETLGPNPIPPWVISKSLPPDTRDSLRQRLLAMDQDPAGQAILTHSPIARFVAVAEQDYDILETRAQIGAQVTLS